LNQCLCGLQGINGWEGAWGLVVVGWFAAALIWLCRADVQEFVWGLGAGVIVACSVCCCCFYGDVVCVFIGQNMPFLQIIKFLGVAFVLCLSPGPDNLFVITLSAMRGVKSGLWLVLGLCSGLVLHTLAVAFGVAALLAATPWAFNALKTVGGLYLLYLAWGAWGAPAQMAANTATPALQPLQAWRRGVFMNVSNPKVVVFFLALFPQFIDNKAGNPIGQTLLLGGLFIATSWLTFSGFALLAGSLGQALQKSAKTQIWLNRCAALVFVALAIKLLLPD
jgi:threonine/homoserine/homoserine lactone efflux protein